MFRRDPALAAVFLASLAVLLLELALTRLFSATMHYHYAFLVISLALFGAGAAGVAISVAPERFRSAPLLRASDAAEALGATTIAALCVALPLTTLPMSEDGSSWRLAAVGLLYLACAVPFVCGGAAITWALLGRSDALPRLYRADLLGAAAGGLLLVPLLNRLGGIDTVLAVPIFALLASAFFARAGGGSPRRPLLGLAGAAALLSLNVAFGFLRLGDAKGTDEREVVFSRWNSFSRVTVSQSGGPLLTIRIDADAATRITQYAGWTSLHGERRRALSALPYVVAPERPDVLVIGPGGGDDVLLARVFRAQRIDAVEVNPLIARDIMQSEPFLTFSGGLFDQPGVRLIVDDARSFARRGGPPYDVIQGTMVDTWAATAAGAFALTENYLYTREAFRDFAARLKPDGMLAFTRWYFEPPDQLLRLVALCRAVMAQSGVPDPDRRLVVVREAFRSDDRVPGLLIWKMSPFTDEDLRILEMNAAEGGHTILFTPRTRPENDFTRLIEAADPETFYRSYPTDVRPPGDDAPFFFNSVRPGDLLSLGARTAEWRKTNAGTAVLFLLLGISATLVLLFIVGPLFASRRRALVDSGTGGLRLLGVFALLGAGYIVAEIVLIQKLILFLGPPVYALTVGLVGMLAFSGIGSGWSGRLGEERAAVTLRWLLAASGAALVLYALALSPLFDRLVHLGRPARIAIAFLALAPLATLMGMPMPGALRRARSSGSAFLPWAWGLNGAASVLGSIGAIVLGLAFGFTAALLTAAAFYGVAFALLPAPTLIRPDASALKPPDAPAPG